MITISEKFKNSKIVRDETPGPGSYLHFSEFGILAPKNYKMYNLKKTNTIKDFYKKKILKRVLSDGNSLMDKRE